MRFFLRREIFIYQALPLKKKKTNVKFYFQLLCPWIKCPQIGKIGTNYCRGRAPITKCVARFGRGRKGDLLGLDLIPGDVRPLPGLRGYTWNACFWQYHLSSGLGTGSFSLGAPPPTMDLLFTSHLSSWPFCLTRRRIKQARLLIGHLMLINKATLFQLMDHNDLYVLDLTPSLKTLAMMVVNRHGLSTEVLHFFSLYYRYSFLNLWFGYFEDFHAHCSF